MTPGLRFSRQGHKKIESRLLIRQLKHRLGICGQYCWYCYMDSLPAKREQQHAREQEGICQYCGSRTIDGRCILCQR